MEAQRYRQRVTFQMQVEEQDSETGALTRTWETVELDSETPLADVPAEVLTGPGREFNAADAKQAETSARINLRWFPDLDQSWRVVWDGRNYDILSWETDLTGRRELRLRVKHGVTDGS